jgi:hypothetical protein
LAGESGCPTLLANYSLSAASCSSESVFSRLLTVADPIVRKKRFAAAWNKVMSLDRYDIM